MNCRPYTYHILLLFLCLHDLILTSWIFLDVNILSHLSKFVADLFSFLFKISLSMPTATSIPVGVNFSFAKLYNYTVNNSVYIINSHTHRIYNSILITGLRVCSKPFLHHDLRTTVNFWHCNELLHAVIIH